MRLSSRWIELRYSFYITGSIRSHGRIAINTKFSKEYSIRFGLLGLYLCGFWDFGNFHFNVLLGKEAVH